MNTTTIRVATEKTAGGLFKAAVEMYRDPQGGSCDILRETGFAADEKNAIARAMRRLADAFADPKAEVYCNVEAAIASRADRWVAANGGTEEPFVSRSGRKLLYCYNPHLGKHAYMDVERDVVLSDDEAMLFMGMM